MHDSNEIRTAIPMFLELGNTERLVGILSDVWVCRKRWRLLARSRYEITYNSARAHDSNEISSASHIFEDQQLSGTSPTARLKRNSEIQDGRR